MFGEQWVRRNSNKLVSDVGRMTNLFTGQYLGNLEGVHMTGDTKPFCMRISQGERANCLAKGYAGESGPVL